MRITMYPIAGYSGIGLVQFFWINTSSSIIWTALIIKGSFLINEIIPKELQAYKWIIILGVIALLILLELFIRKKVISKHHQDLGDT